MKTTIDIPEALYRKAKIRAARTGSTLRDLVVGALEGSLMEVPSKPAPKGGRKKTRNGVPLLPAGDRPVVTNEFINQLRDELGI
ncbi:MAG TPA: hypothetical protein VIS74_04165 [Chthoniobacterales bacterium]